MCLGISENRQRQGKLSVIDLERVVCEVKMVFTSSVFQSGFNLQPHGVRQKFDAETFDGGRERREEYHNSLSHIDV